MLLARDWVRSRRARCGRPVGHESVDQDLVATHLASLSREQKLAIYVNLTLFERQRRTRVAEDDGRVYDWAKLARPNQLPPDGDWSFWMLLAGRGFGKTRTGAEWIKSAHTR